MKCRFCQHVLSHVFIDLVNSPPSNSFLTQKQLDEPETYYPLKLFVCESCWLVQIDEYKKSVDIFNHNYPYFSSYSKSWLDHAQKYAEMVSQKLLLNENTYIVEIGSNDGYLLQYFSKKNIPCLGIEPAEVAAIEAKKKRNSSNYRFFYAKPCENVNKKRKKCRSDYWK